MAKKKAKKKTGRPKGEPTTTVSVRHSVAIIDKARKNDKGKTMHKDLQLVIEKYAEQ